MIRINLNPSARNRAAARSGRWSPLLISTLIHAGGAAAAVSIAVGIAVAPAPRPAEWRVALRIQEPSGPPPDFSTPDLTDRLPAPAALAEIEVFPAPPDEPVRLEDPEPPRLPETDPPVVAAPDPALLTSRIPAERRNVGASESRSVGASGRPDGPTLPLSDAPTLRLSDAASAYTPPAPDGEFNTPPQYPAIAVRRGWHGRVLVRALVDAAGRPTRVELAESSGHGDLDDAALAAVRGWRFKPATRGGTPEPALLQIPVVFKLTD